MNLQFSTPFIQLQIFVCLALLAIIACANAGLLDLLGEKFGKGGGGGGNSGASVVKVCIFRIPIECMPFET